MQSKPVKQIPIVPNNNYYNHNVPNTQTVMKRDTGATIKSTNSNENHE